MHNSDINKNKEKQIFTTDETLTLYHGSKSGIHGPIAPISRERCGFHSGQV